MYSVRGRTAATAANIDDAVFGFWNPHGTAIVRLMAILMVTQSSTSQPWNAGIFRRTTARGTPATTVTPDISNDGRYGVGPVSGVLLDTSFSAQPTLEADDWGPRAGVGFVTSNEGQVALMHRFQGSGLYIPPGTGIALIQKEAIVSPVFEVGLSWLED